LKYYDDSEMKNLREIFEEEVLQWPGITTKKMFGCPCYKANDKLFAFLVTKGIVLTKLSEPERKNISKQYNTTPFQAGKKTMSAWIQTQVKEIEDLSELIPYVKKSYKAALGK
jgi:hypothetical protein